ncbi:branched-chain amino acid transport system ATP-binding protein [Azospirillum fermentarium]|uniref:ABC transporter ATP-binding protein n=1 Tax=Azospirillum fermentarium TaxID=1233114 RepID=UPI0022272BF1|nr:ABC transporter ATP-binding protein [Azospirillum fermentarium]MCW2247965.1 branched-chain amino acid transport system ATP-binding protein [Azospirillum fermentarium]
MSTALFELDGVSVSYGRIEAVRQVSLSIQPGQIVTVVGANGAGKTTLLNAAMGILPATGAIRFQGRAVDALSIEERVTAGIALVAEKRELFATMAVEDNLRLGAYTRPRGERVADALEEVYTLFPRLKERRKQAAGTMSGGERQMLAMGRALMAKPRVLMLDEPSLGLAPRIVKEILELVSDLRRTGVGILLVEQNARAALRIADYGYVMETGTVTLEGPASTLAADPRVIESYLGLSGQAA